MVFSSLFFICFFLVLCLASLYAARHSVKQQNLVLLGFSLVFYAWGGPLFLLLLAGMTLIAYAGARLLDEIEDVFFRKLTLFMTIALMLLLLGFFKYAGWMAENVITLFGLDLTPPKILLPIGISFYTFQLLSYVADVYRKQVASQKKYWMLLLYASLFHQCIAGPIVRYSDVEAQLENRTITKDDLSAGISRFAAGLAKKALFANLCGEIADSLLSASSLASASGGSVFLGGLFYMFQIYLDFSAYSDMAIGMGRACGLRYVENFNYPYMASSVTDFWRRWHISLSTFFRDYVYIPLGGNRKGKGRQIFNLFVVWALTGLWHGAAWNYLFWGLYYFAFLVLEKFVIRPERIEKIGFKFLYRIGVLAVVYFGWLLFYFEDLSLLGLALKDLFGAHRLWDYAATLTLKNNLFFLPAAALACLPVVPTCKKLWGKLAAKLPTIAPVGEVADMVLPLVLLILSVIFLVGNTYNPFLYFQF